MQRQHHRIAVVTPFFPTGEKPHDGRPTYELVKRLAALADVLVICPVPRYPTWLRPRNFDYAPVDRTFSLPDVRVEYLEFPALPLITRFSNGNRCAASLLARLRRNAPDVILNYWVYPQGYAAVQAAKKLGVPAIVGAIGSDLNAIADPITRHFTRLTLRQAAFVTCKSQALRECALQLGTDAAKIRTIGNGCDTTTFQPADRRQARQILGIAPEQELVLFVGRLETAKGILELVEAIQRLSTGRRNIAVAFVGGGTAQSQLEGKAKALGITNKVRLISPLPSTGVAQWLAAANLIALPSYAEGCPNVILEAISCGRPVIATKVGGIPEIVDDQCSVLVPPRDISALADAIDAGLNRTWDQQAIANRFRRSWEDMAKEIYEVCLSSIDAMHAQNL